MQREFDLRLDAQPIALGDSGLTLIAPGLQGKGTWVLGGPGDGLRDDAGPGDAVDEAIADANLERRHVIVIDAPTPAVATGATRFAGDVAADEVQLNVPVEADQTSYVVYRDEAGVCSVHYPESRASQGASGARGIDGDEVDVIRVPLRSAEPSAGTGESRGLGGKAVAKVIRVVMVRLLPGTVGKIATAQVKSWETRCRAFKGLHGGSSLQLLAPDPVPVRDLRPFDGQRSLLFIHGTTSSTAGAFAGLKTQSVLEELHAAYGGRLIGFNHHTLCDSVATNVREFFDALAVTGGSFEFDVVCHSRGGLVARALPDLSDDEISRHTGSPWQRPSNVSVKVRRIVFVATPNGGTDLAIPERIAGFVDRMVNVLNWLPDSPVTIGGGAIMSIAASIAEVALPRLPGLADQAPGSALLLALRSAPAAIEAHAAYQASYAAEGALAGAVADTVMDRLFGQKANDLVVPTEGVSVFADLAISPERIVRFGASDGVHHTNFFKHPAIADIARFLR